MDEINDNLVPLTNATPEDLNEALEGQPEPVKEDKPFNSYMDRVAVDDVNMDDMAYTDDDGNVRLYNSQDGYVGLDLDPLEDRTFVSGLKKGFTYTNPDDLYNKSQEAQPFYEKMINGTLQFVGDTTLNVAQGIGGTFYGLGSAIANRDLTKFYDNSVTNALDDAEKWWGQTFEVKTGGNQAWYNKFGNFVFNDFFGGLSFLVGAVATEAILTGVSTLSLGAAAPIQGIATTGLVARGARILKQMGHRGKRLVGGKLYDDAVKGIDQLGTNATRVQAVTGMTQAGRQVGRAQRNNALARMSRQIMTGAGMEASMEARHALHESVEDFKRRYEEVNGRGSFTPEMEEKALQEFSKTTDSTFWQNLALVGVSNMLMFPKLFGYGGGKAMRYVGLKDVNKMSTARKTRLAKRLGVTVEDLPKYVEGRTGIKGLRNAMFAFDDLSTFGLGKHTRLGRLARATAIARRGLYEGVIEEGGQGVMSRYAKNYIEAAYDLDLQKKEVDKQRALMEGFGGAYTSAQGLTEIGIGVMLGVMGAPWGKVTRDSQGKAKFQFQLLGGAQEVRNRIKERDAEIQGIVDLHEANGDVLGIMGAEIRNSLSQQALQRDYNAAALAGDFKRLKDVEQNQIFSHAASKIITGRYEDALVEAKEILDDMTAEDYREMLGDQGANMTTEELETRKRHVYDNYVKHMEAAKKAFEQAGDIYRGDKPEVYSAIANMMYNVEANDFREKALADKITQVLVDLSRGQILDASRIKAELGIREEDIEKLLAIREKLRRIEKGLETKFKRGIIKNVNIEKAEARFEEDSKARKEVEKLRDQEKALVDSFLSRRTAQEAVDNEYGFDLDRQVERINALIDMHAALDAISLVDTDLDVQDIQTTVNDLFEISQDRLELIRMHNNLLERGGVQRLVDNVSTIIQAKINSYVDEDERARNRDKDKEGTDLPNDKVREGQDADTAVDTDVPIDPDDPSGVPETGEAAEAPENMFDPEDAPPVEEEEEGPAPDDVPVSDLKGSGTQGASQAAEDRKQQAKAREEQRSKRTDTTVEEKPNSTRKSDEQKDNKAGLLYFDIDDVRGLKEGTTMVQRHIAVRGTGGMVFKAFMVPGDSRVHIEIDGELSDPEIRDAYQGEDALLMTLSRDEAEKRFGPEAFALFTRTNGPRQAYKFRLGGTGEGLYGGGRVQYRRGNTVVGGPIRVSDRLEGNLDAIVDVVYQVTSAKYGNVWFSAVTGNDISKQADKEVLEFVTDTDYGVGMKNFVSAGRPYLVVRDGRTGKLAWSQIRGATIGKDTAHFLHRTLEVLNVASGTLELDKTTMTQEAYDKSKQVLEDVFDVNFGLEGKELQKEFKKVASFITGRKVFSEFNEVRQWQKNTKAGTSQWSLVVHNDRPAELVVMPAGFNPFQELRDENGKVITNQAGKPRRIKSSWSSYDVNGDYLMYLAQIPQGIEMAQRPMANKGMIFSDLRLGENKELVANGIPVKQYIGDNYNFIDRAPMWITDPISGEKVLYAHRYGNLAIYDIDGFMAGGRSTPPADTESSSVQGQSSSEEDNSNLPAWLQPFDDNDVESNVTTADPSSEDDNSGDDNTETESRSTRQEREAVLQQSDIIPDGNYIKVEHPQGTKDLLKKYVRGYLGDVLTLDIKSAAFNNQQLVLYVQPGDTELEVRVPASIMQMGGGATTILEVDTKQVINAYFDTIEEAGQGVEDEFPSDNYEDDDDGPDPSNIPVSDFGRSKHPSVRSHTQKRDPKKKKLTPMQRANRNLRVRGLTVQQTEETVNILTGLAAQYIHRHRVSVNRENDIVMRDIKREVHKELGRIMRVQFSRPGFQDKLSKQQLNAIKNLLEGGQNSPYSQTFDRAFVLTLQRLMSNTHGMIDISANNMKKLEEINEQIASFTDEDYDREDLSMKEFEDKFSFTIDPKATQGRALRQALMGIGYTHADANTRTFLGILKFVTHDQISGILSETLNGVEPTYPEVEQRLKNAVAKYPYLQSVLDALDLEALSEEDPLYRNKWNMRVQLRQQMVVFGARDYTNFVSTKFKIVGREFGTVYQFNSNDRNMGAHALENFLARLITNNFYTYDSKGNARINKPKFKAFVDQLDAITKSDTTHADKAAKISKLFQKELKLNVPAHIFSSDVRTMENIEIELQAGNETMEPSTAFGHFRAVMRAASTTKDLYVNINSLPQTQRFKEFFFLVASQGENLIQKTSKDAAGNVRYQYVQRKLLSDRFRHLRDRFTNEDIEAMSPSMQQNRFIKTWREGDPDNIRVDHHDSFNRLRSSLTPKEWLAMSPAERKIDQLIMYGNDNNYVPRGGRRIMIARFAPPTISDKSTLPLIQTESRDIRVKTGDTVTRGRKKWFTHQMPIKMLKMTDFIDVNHYYKENIYHLVEEELTRIVNIREKNFDNLPTEAQREAEALIHFPSLNQFLDKYDIATLNGRQDFHKAAKKEIQRLLDKDFQHTLEQLEQAEVFDTLEDNEDILSDDGQTKFTNLKGTIKNLRFFNIGQLRSRGDTTGKSDLEYMLNHLGIDPADIDNHSARKVFLAYVAKYTAESRAVRAHTIQFVMGDVGVYWKGSVRATVHNIQKRLASLIAPGEVKPVVNKELIPDTPGVDSMGNTYVDRLVVNDHVMKAQNMADLKKILSEQDLKAYEKIVATDGAEWITPRERLLDLLGEGRITPKEFHGLLTKAEAGVPLDKAEKAWFRPGKPVAAGFHGDHHFYVKSAEFVLLPQDIKGTSFMRLYDLMMDPQIMIGRITHRSAYKVGIRAGSVLDIYEEDGTIRKFTKKEIQELRNMEHPARYRQHRETMRRQQEVPAKQTLETVHGSQVSKLFNVQTHGLTGFNEYGEFDDFEFEGELKGEDLQGIYNATRLVENQAKMALFRKRYGVGTPAYKEKMAVRLMEEALTRGYDFNEVAGLHFDSETGKFAVPLWGTASAGRIDSLMFSILYNEVIKPKINGFGGPIAPETGWRVLSIDDAKTSGIAWVVDKKGKPLWDGKRLKTLSEGGVDEIILPWKFKEDIKDYVDKDGNISADKLDDKLLNIFGYRLPTQSKASASTFRVVGFSRPEMGDRIIVAEELVGRIGQDYDIDKLMTFLYNYEEQTDKKGRKRLVVKDSLTKDQIMSEMRRNGDRVSDEDPLDYDSMSEEELEELIESAQNTMIDAYHSVMRNSNPEVQQYIHEPIGDGYAEQLADIVGEREDQDLDPYGVEYNDYTTADASAALDALGVFASQTALHGVINMNRLDVYFASGNFYNVVQIGDSATTGLMHNGEAVKPWMLAKLGKNEIVDSNFVLKGEGYNPVAGTVSKQFNRLMNHSVDNQNNGLLGRLRISKETYPLWTMLTHMGYNQETIELIVQSEVARDVVREAQTKNSMTASFFQLDDHLKRRIYYTRLELLQTFLTKDEKKLEDLSGTELENAVQVAMGRLQEYRKKNGYVYDLNKDWLVADFEGRKLPKRERLMHEIAIMEAWRSTIRSSNKLLSWNRTMRLDTKFPRHREEMNMRLQQSQDFYSPLASINLELGLGIPRGIQMADGIGFGNYPILMRMEAEATKLRKAIGPDYRKDPRYKAMRAQINAFKAEEHDRMRRIILTETSVGQLTSALFQLRKEGALSMADEHLDETYLYRSAAAYFREQGNSEKKLRQYILGLRSYHFAKLAEKIDGERTAKQMRAAFMDTDGTNLPARITAVMSKYPGLRKNAFLRHLVLNTSRDAHGYYTVEFTGDRNLTVSSQEPLAAFLDLLTHKNAEIRAVGEDLVKYALVTGGNLGSRSFTKYVVNEYLEQNGLRAEMIGQVERDNAFWGTDAHAQIVMHNHDLIPRSEFFVQRLQYENKEDDFQATSISFKRGDRNAPSDMDPTLSFGFVRDARTRRPYRIGRYLGMDKEFFKYELIPLEGRKGDFLHKEYGSDFEFSPELQRTRPDANPGQQDNNEPPADLFDEDGPDMMGVSDPDPNEIPVSDMMGTGTTTDPAPEEGSAVDTESTQITYKGQTYTVTYSDQPGPDGRIAGGKIINNKTGREVNVTGPTGSKVLDLWIESQEMTEEPPDPNDVPISNFGQGKFGFPRNKPAGIIEQPLSLMQSVSIVYQLRGELKAIGTKEEYAEYLLSRMGNTSLPQVLWHAGSARYGKPKLPTKDEVRASGTTLMKNEAGEFQPAVYLSNDITDAASYLASKDSIPELYGALVLDSKARLLPMKDTFDQEGYYQDEQGRYRDVETKQIVTLDKLSFDTQFRVGESSVVMRGIADLAVNTKWQQLGAMGLKLRDFLNERDMGPQSNRYPSTVAVRDVDKVVLLGSVEDRQAFAAWKQNKQQSVTAVPRTRIIVPTTQNPLRRFVERGDMSTNPLLESFSLMEDALPMHMRVNFEAQTDSNGITYYDADRHTIVARADIAEQELTHEMVHAYTVWATENDIPAEAEMALSRIKRLRRELTEDRAAMMQMGLSIKELNQFRRGYNLFFKMEDVVNNEKYMGNRRVYRSELTAEQNADIDFFLDQDNYDRMYGFMNDQEFMAEALSNPVFANQLARVPSGVMSGPRRRGGFRNQHTRNMWEKVMAFIADVLEGMGVAYGDNMATEVAYYAARVMNAKAEQARKADPSQAKRYPKPPSVSYSARSRTRKKRPSGNNVNAMVQYKRIRIQELREVRAKFSGSDSVLKSIDTRIARETEDLELLTDDSVGADKVAAMVRRELDDMDQMLDRMAEVKTPTLGVLTSLRSMQTTLSFYAGFGGKIKLEGMDRETLRELVGRANSMMDEYLDIMREVLRMAARERYAGTPSEERVKDDSFKNIDPINWARANLLGAGRQGRIEHSFLDDVIKDMYQRQRADYNQRVKKYDELSAKFKTTDYYLKHGWDGLVELDADGNPTNRIISPLSGTWTQEEHRRRSIALTEKTDEAWQSYYKWLQEHTGRIDIERLYELDKRVVTRKTDLVYERQLEKTYGKLGAEEFLKRQDKLIKNYADARQSAFDVIDMELPGEANKAANKQRKLEWLDLNSPAKHYLYYEKGVDRPANAKNKYLAHMPLPEVNGKKTGFYDERFVDMQKEPEAVAYYEYLRGQFKELMAGLPMDIYADNLHQIEQGLFLPGMRKAMTVSLLNPRAMVRRQADKFIDSITTVDEEIQSRMIDPITGEVRRDIPVKYMQRLRDTTNQEFNMDIVYKKFTMMATNFIAKNMIEDVVRLTETAISNAGITHTDSSGKRIVDPATGEAMVSTEAGARKNVLASAQASIREFYGQQSQKKSRYLFGKKKPRTKEEKARAKEIDDKIREADIALEQSRMDPENHSALVMKLQEERDKIGSRLDAGKMFRGLLKFTQARGMGYNVPAAFTNYVFGAMSTYQYAARRTDFDERDADKAFHLMLHRTLSAVTANTGLTRTGTARKIAAMMVRYDILKDFSEVQYDPTVDKTTFDKLVEKTLLYQMQRSSEYFVYGHSTIAAMLGTKIGDKNAWELMDEDGIIDVEGYRPGEEEFNKLAGRINQINMAIHGNYDIQSPIAFKQTLVGPALMQFKSWLPEAAAQEFGSRVYDTQLGREVQGSFQALMNEPAEFVRNLLIPKALIPVYRRHATYNFQDPVNEESARRAYAKIYQIMQLYFLYAFLGAMVDDEDDPQMRQLLTFMLNISSRVKNDLMFFVSPKSYLDITRGAPAIETIGDVMTFTDAVFKTMQGDGTIPTGIYAGRSRMLHHGGNLIPYGKAINRQLYNMTVTPND